MNHYITIRAKAFSGEGVRVHKARVDSDGTVRVYDPIAHHYTTCHSLTRAALRRARKAASGVGHLPTGCTVDPESDES